MSPSFFEKSFQESSHLPLIGPVLLQNMFMTKKNEFDKIERVFLSILGQGRKTPFMFYTGIMVLEKCRKHRCHRRVATLMELPWENQLFPYMECPNHFLDNSNDK